MIDEMEVFVQNYIDCKLTGYSLSNEDWWYEYDLQCW
jgi:hypothetical protein